LGPTSRAIRLSGVSALIFLSFQVLAPAQAATTYTMTLRTDSPSYSGGQPITITGVLSPAPGPNTAVIITIRNHAGSIADVNEVLVLANGSFGWTSYPGGSAAWSSGAFSVNATWGGDGATASRVVTFAYAAVPTSTTTSAASTTDTTTKSSTTSTTTSPPNSTTKSTATVVTSTTPEFPPSVLAAVALACLALVAAFSRWTSRPSGGASGRPRWPARAVKTD
jgi:hypothetical protein